MAGRRARLVAGDERFAVSPGPYFLPFEGSAELVAASTLDELADVDARGRILLLHGAIAAEPLAPRNYFFYNPEGHQAVYRLIDEKRPAAVSPRPAAVRAQPEAPTRSRSSTTATSTSRPRF